MWPLQTQVSRGLWHTTHPSRLKSVLTTGLKSEPDIPDSERWKSSFGPDYHPFIRTLGGVSLFNFVEFEPEAYSLTYPLSSWRTFIPHRVDWGGAVWIAIDQDVIADRFISTHDLVGRWKNGGHYKHTIMPRIECACIGNVPVSAFQSAFLTWGGGDNIRDISIKNFDEAAYEAILSDWQVSISDRG